MAIDNTPANADRAFQWQHNRRKPGGSFVIPVNGFGEQAQYTLWLPPTGYTQKYVFKDGKPSRVEIESPMITPAIVALRDQVIRSFAPNSAGVMTADLTFLEYAGAVLAVNYTLSDEDLTEALAGRKWHAGVVHHLIGCDGTFDAMLAALPMITTGTPPVPDSSTIFAPPPRGWFARLRKRR